MQATGTFFVVPVGAPDAAPGHAEISIAHLGARTGVTARLARGAVGEPSRAAACGEPSPSAARADGVAR